MLRNIKNKIVLFILFALPITLFIGCSDSWDDHYKEDYRRGTDRKTVFNRLSEQGYTAFVEALKKTKYDVALSGMKSFTVLAPENEAFKAATQGLSDEELRTLVGYHIIEPGYFDYELETDTFKTISKRYVFYNEENKTFGNKYDADITLTEGKINILCDNGVIHGINGVLKPYTTVYDALKSKYSSFMAMIETFMVMDPKKKIYESGFDAEGNGKIDSSYYYEQRWFDLFDLKQQKTLFVVNNEVFDKSFAPVVRAYTGYKDAAKEMSKLYKDIFDFHFVQGRLMSKDFGNNIRTLGNKVIDIKMNHMVKGKIDQKYTDGVIHEMDTLLFNSLEAKDFLMTMENTLVSNFSDLGIPKDESTSVSSHSRVDPIDDCVVLKPLNTEPAPIGEYFQITMKDVLAADYEVIIGYKPLTRYCIMQLEIDGKEFGEQVDFRVEQVYSHTYADTLRFDKYGDHTIRFKVAGTSAVNSVDKMYRMKVEWIKFVPIDPYKKEEGQAEEE